MRSSAFLLALAVLAVLLTGCASSVGAPVPFKSEALPTEAASTEPVDFQIIYIVHGDANYSYHDSTGKRHTADSEAVAQALDVARHSPRSEVFVFHQQARHPRLFHRAPDGVAYHYRRGALLHEEAYFRIKGGNFLVESDLLRKYRVPSAPQPLSRFFVYFGHEIPPAELARGLDLFKEPPSSPQNPFALIVLSTCYGGTPAMMETLAPRARFALASPAYLHLSFLDTRAFKRLPEPGSVPFDTGKIHALAADMARQSFERLKENTQTEITVAVYDLQKTAFPGLFSNSRNGNTRSHGYHDCAEDSGFDSTVAAEGVEAYYQAPKFGALKNKPRHSGWECPGHGV